MEERNQSDPPHMGNQGMACAPNEPEDQKPEEGSSVKVKLILPALTEATGPFWRPIKYSLFPPLGLATLAGYLGPEDEVVIEDEPAGPGGDSGLHHLGLSRLRDRRPLSRKGGARGFGGLARQLAVDRPGSVEPRPGVRRPAAPGLCGGVEKVRGLVGGDHQGPAGGERSPRIGDRAGRRPAAVTPSRRLACFPD